MTNYKDGYYWVKISETCNWRLMDKFDNSWYYLTLKYSQEELFKIGEHITYPDE